MMRLKARLIFYGCVLALLALAVLYATSMPGSSHTGALPASTPELRELSQRLHDHVVVLAERIGTRSLDRAENLEQARQYLAGQLTPLASAENSLQFEDVGAEGGHAKNVIFEVSGKDNHRIVVVGAHYDSVDTGPGANDNGSGVAATLELAKRFFGAPNR